MTKEFRDNSKLSLVVRDNISTILHEYRNNILCTISDNENNIQYITDNILSYSTFSPFIVSSVTDCDGNVYDNKLLYSTIYDEYIYALYIIIDDSIIYIFDKELYYY